MKVVGGPVLPRPQDGWTAATADTFCSEYIRAAEVVGRCEAVPGVSVDTALANCRRDVLVSPPLQCTQNQ